MSYLKAAAKKLEKFKNGQDTIILAVETSCDETSCAVLKNGREALSNVISTQVDIHRKYGGVVPEIASRKHIELIDYVIDQALREAGVSLRDLDAVAVTNGPGLVGALLVGVSHAKAMAFALGVPLVGVHHIEGHICANYVQHKDLEPPFVCLVVSGGHSHLVHVKDYGRYEILGRTRDDAAGEAFDKVARALGLGYPGGPLIDKAAKEGNETAISFPIAQLKNGELNFSFSGIKTAVLNYLNHQRQKGLSIIIEDVAASFQKAVVDALVENTLKAAKVKKVKTIAVAGGVAANSRLRQELTERAASEFDVKFPPMILCTDNAAMIACTGYYRYLMGDRSDMTLTPYATLKPF